MPAACLSELIRVGVKGVKRLRQFAAVLLWGALFAFPFVFILVFIPDMRDDSTLCLFWYALFIDYFVLWS